MPSLTRHEPKASSSLVLSCAVLLGAAYLTMNAPAQAGPKEELTARKQRQVLDAICRKLEELYPVPESKKKTIAGIRKNQREGKYKNIVSPDVFARRVTVDLENLSQDKHLDLLYDPSLAAEIAKQKDASEVPMAASEAEQYRWENFGFRNLKILNGNVGYLDLRVFFAARYAGPVAVSAMGFFSGCAALIVDLRNNGGGWDDMVTLLAGFFVKGDEAKTVSISYSNLDKKYYASMISPYVPGKRLTNIPIYILISGSTASAAEAFTQILKHFNPQVTLVGENTAGAENPVEYVVIPHDFVLKIPSWKRIYAFPGHGWERKGIPPDIPVKSSKALETAHMHALETMLRSARDKLAREKLQWGLEGIRAVAQPRIVDRRILKSYVGSYGKVHIQLPADGLTCQYKQGPEIRLLPITDAYFLLEGRDDRRIRFIKKKGKVTQLKYIYSDGYQAIYLKDRKAN